MSDSDEQVCPLCCEELDISDQNFLPCKCGYQVCMWCWHHIKENLNNLCPACRNPYHDNPHAFSAVEKEEIMRNKREMKLREKEKKERNKEKREAIVAATGVQRIPLPSEHPLTLRRNRAGSDSENAPNRQQRRAEAKRNAELLEEQQRQQAIAASLRDQEQAKRPEGRPPRAPTQSYGYGSSTDNLQSLGGEYGFGRGGSTGLDSLLGGTRAPAPPPPPQQQQRQPPLDVAGLWNAPAPAPPSNGHRPAFRLDASPVAGAGFFDSGSIWSTNYSTQGDGWGAPAPSAPSGSNGFGGGGLYAPAPESSDAYAADSLAADTAALNLLSVGYGDADRRRYAPRQQGYGGY
mmetsp:Transcript_8718/g.23674  ORF Transcript_8718/g.23674 Transcript_8718/m.23674 type:complete len:348 (-) Transcript_8718:177-1220(-)